MPFPCVTQTEPRQDLIHYCRTFVRPPERAIHSYVLSDQTIWTLWLMRQTVILWAPAVEMVLTGSSSNGSLLGWELGPLRQSAKLWLHDAGITHVHELVRRRYICVGGYVFVVSFVDICGRCRRRHCYYFIATTSINNCSASTMNSDQYVCQNIRRSTICRRVQRPFRNALLHALPFASCL